MDHSKFIEVIKQFPQVWNRNCSSFREQSLKSDAWERIGIIMNTAGSTCKDAFKSLREKYVREREKQAMYGNKYLPWQHLEALSFLDPFIILRKQSLNLEHDDKVVIEENKTGFADDALLMQFAESSSDFDKTLITLVRKACPIWDRRSNGYPSKQVKYQLWRNIAQTMRKDVNVCMTRWKGLREKYIRQRSKYQEGDGKWEFLDDMAFLDNVIQYRRKNFEPEVCYQPVSSFPFNMPPQDDNSVNDSSSSDFMIKTESHDSSYDSGSAPLSRKRSTSDRSECESPPDKRHAPQDVLQKSPELMFGELVAAMLSRKSEREKNIAMIEIMQVLTK